MKKKAGNVTSVPADANEEDAFTPAATAERTECPVAVRRVVTCSVLVSPAAVAPSGHTTFMPDGWQAPVAETNSAPDGSVAVMVTPSAESGPLFRTSREYSTS